jgi:hypothetical protein
MGPEPVLLDQLFVSSWLADWDVSKQPFLKALGGSMALEAFAQAVDIWGLTCVPRNDAAAALVQQGQPSVPSDVALCSAA